MLGEIIAIGNELTSGRILNTNSRFAAGQLFSAGLPSVESDYTINGYEVLMVVHQLLFVNQNVDYQQLGSCCHGLIFLWLNPFSFQDTFRDFEKLGLNKLCSTVFFDSF